jgi:hypothetical protein
MKKQNCIRFAPTGISSFILLHSSFPFIVAGECELRGKSSLLLSFLESVPAVSAKLKAPVTADRKFEDVVKSAQDAAVLVLVY